MAKFRGAVGYREGQNEKKPGMFVDVIREKFYKCEVQRNSRQLQSGENFHPNLTVNNSISIVADEYANEYFHAILFVVWAGKPWTVEEVTVQGPRLLLRLGGVYDGPRAEVEDGAPL